MIDFSRPSWLYGLLGLLALWLLRLWWRRRRRRPVPSLPFLERALERLGALRPGSIWRQRLRDLGLMLALAALLTALAEPHVVLPRPAATEYALVIDVSASMGAREPDGRLRIEWARDVARELIARRGPRERFLLAAASEDTEIVAPLGAPSSVLRRRLRDLTWRPAGDDLWRAVRRLRPPSSPDRRVLLVSDFSSPLARRLAASPPDGVHLYPVGEARENLSLEGATWTPGPPEAGHRLRCDVVDQGAAGDDRVVDVVISADEQVLRELMVSVPRGGRALIDEQLALDRSSRVTLAIRTKDENALDIDDRAHFVSAGQEPIPLRVWLGPPEDPHLAAMVEVLGDGLCEVERLTDPAAIWQEAPGKSVVLADRLTIDQPLPAGRYVLFAPEGSRSPIRATRELTSGPIVSWDLGHPAVRGLIFDDVAIQRSPLLQLEEDEVPLLSTEEGVVAAAHERSDARVLTVSFSPVQSTWWSSGSFPLFLVQTVRWLSGSRVQLPAGARSGEGIPVDPELGDHPGRPPGLPVEELPGFERLEGLPGAPAIGVSFELPSESSIAPGGRALPRPAPALEEHRASLAIWLVVISLGLVLFVAWL